MQAPPTSVDKYAQIVRISPVAIAVTELESARLVDFNEAFERTFHVSRQVALGRTLIELGCWQDPSARLRMIETIREHGSIRDYEVHARAYTGEPLLVLLSSELLSIDGLPCLVTYVNDITERDRTERALRESEQKFERAFRLSPYAISIIDRKTGNYVDVNQAWVTLFEASREEVIGHNSAELGVWDDAAARARLQAIRQEHGQVRDFPATGHTLKGAELHGLISSEMIEIGGRECYISIVRDVTQQWHADKLRGELEHQLRNAQKLEALGVLAGGIAHDFNNILGAVMAYTDLIKLDASDPALVLSHVQELRSAGTRAKDLVQQILTFSRRQKQERRPVRLDLVTREALKLLRAALPATIELEWFIAAELPVILADPSQIHQVLMNLGTNAAHAMKDRSGKLLVRLEAVDVSSNLAREQEDLHTGCNVRLTVTDSGRGMDEYTIKRIFEPFFSTKAPGEGTGLGLSVVHGIVREHDGSIAVRSVPGEGTTFELHFPEHPAELTTDAPLEEGLATGDGEHVLLVDDEPLLRHSLSRLLVRLGYRVTVRQGPIGALELFFNDPNAIDLVLTDLTMPMMTGVEMAREMLTVRPGVRVIVMSGYSATWNAESLSEVGISALLSKPITASALASALRAALAGSLPSSAAR